MTAESLSPSVRTTARPAGLSSRRNRERLIKGIAYSSVRSSRSPMSSRCSGWSVHRSRPIPRCFSCHRRCGRSPRSGRTTLPPRRTSPSGATCSIRSSSVRSRSRHGGVVLADCLRLCAGALAGPQHHVYYLPEHDHAAAPGDDDPALHRLSLSGLGRARCGRWWCLPSLATSSTSSSCASSS